VGAEGAAIIESRPPRTPDATIVSRNRVAR
jgi:hypothetical protein